MPKDSENSEKISEKPLAKVTFSGTTKDVMDQIKGEHDDSEKKDEKEPKKTKKDIMDTFQDSSNRVVVIRESPEDLGGRILIKEFEMLCPTNLNEIRERIINEFGGVNWMAQVKDDFGNVLVAVPIKVKAPPKAVFAEDPEQEDEFGFGEEVVVDRKGKRMNFRFPSRDEREEKEDAMQKMMEDMLLQKKQALVMDQMNKMLASDDTNNKKKGREESDFKDLVTSIQNSNREVILAMEKKFDDKLSALERTLTESKYEKKIAELTAMMTEKNTMNDLKNQISNIQKDFQTALMSLKTDLKGGDSDKTLKVFLDSNDKMMAVVNSSLNARVDSMQASNKDFKELFTAMHDDKQSGKKDPLDSVKDLIGIATGIAGLNRPEPEEVGPLTTEDRLIKAFTDVTPQVLGFFKDRKNPTEDEVKKAIEDRARDLARGIVEKMKQNPAQITNKEPKKIANPTKVEDPKVKIAEGVNHVLSVLNQEIDVMAIAPKWIGTAFNYLPKDELIKLSESEDVTAMLPTLKEYANPTLIAELGFKLLMDKKKRAWLESGLKTLKEAVKEAIEAENRPDNANDEGDEGEESDEEVEDGDGDEAPAGSDGDII